MQTLAQQVYTTQEGILSCSTSSLVVNGEVQWRTGRWRVDDQAHDPDTVIPIRGATLDRPGLEAPESEANLHEIERHPEITAEIDSLKQFIQMSLTPAPVEFVIEHFAHQEDDDELPIQLINLVATAPADVDDHRCADLTLELLHRLAASTSILVRRYLTVSIR